MRTIILFVKCFDEIIVHINKSAVFDTYMKHKKHPGSLVCKPGCLISSRNLPGGEPVIDVCCFLCKGYASFVSICWRQQMIYRSTVIVISSPAKNARSTALYRRR